MIEYVNILNFFVRNTSVAFYSQIWSVYHL